MNRPTWITLLGFMTTACHPAPRMAAVASPNAGSRIDTFTVSMPELGGRERTVRVYLPPGYASSRTAFPVLYLQDAQQLFTAGWFGDWRVDETLDSLVAAGQSKGLIVVGIDNGPRRWDEYGPWVNTHMMDWVDSTWSRRSEGGEGEAYLRFLTNTLKPEIDRRYRTLRNRNNTAIGGSSMGGLISLYAGVTRPDVFSKVMAMSTAVWFAEDGGAWMSSNRLISMLHGRALPQDVRFYVDVGTNERSRDTDPDVKDPQGLPVTYPEAYLQGNKAMVAALAAGGVPRSHLKFVVDTGGIHNEKSWAARFGGAVQWLFQ